MILALDQSTNITGFAVFSKDGKLVYSGVFTTKSKNIDGKILELTDYMLYLIERFGITHVVMEDVQQQSNAKTFKHLSMVLGACVKQCLICGVTHTIVTPSTWRAYLGIKTRPRNEAKAGAKLYVMMQYGVDCKKDDESDAISIGAWYVANTAA